MKIGIQSKILNRKITACGSFRGVQSRSLIQKSLYATEAMPETQLQKSADSKPMKRKNVDFLSHQRELFPLKSQASIRCTSTDSLKQKEDFLISKTSDECNHFDHVRFVCVCVQLCCILHTCVISLHSSLGC